MGVNQSVQVAEEREAEEEEEEEEEEDEGDEDEDDADDNDGPDRMLLDKYLVKKVLEQEPEMLACYASASPLSPQLSSLGTPRLGPSIKVWDPYNVLAPPPPPVFTRSFSPNLIDDDRVVMELFLITHGECELNLRPDLMSGRCPEAALTQNGKRQARALAVFLKSQGVRFNSIYSSPLNRARSTAVSVCQEMSMAEDQIQTSDSLMEMSQGDWEGCLRSEIYTLETLSFIDRLQPDFCAPSGETFRQVEFRMVQFLVKIVLELSEKLSSDFSHQISHALNNSIHDPPPLPQWDSLHRQRHGFSRKKYGKSRLQYVNKPGENDGEADNSSRYMNGRSSASNIFPSIGVFTHSVPIKCLLTGLLGCSTLALHKFIIEDSSVTVLQHSLKTGWQIKRLNETAHLRLL